MNIHLRKFSYITNHSFNHYVELLDIPFQGTNIPYLDSSSDVDDIVIDLINEWKPDLRYKYGNRNRHTLFEIEKLIDSCVIIYNQVSRNI